MVLAAPVGPIAFVCIQRSFANGRLHGIISGLGIAIADVFYAAVTAFGLALISDFLLSYQWFFRLFGGLALVAVGLRIVFAATPEVTTDTQNESYLSDFTTMFAFALANPLTILFFAIIIPAFGVVISGSGWIIPTIFVTGVFLGEMGWWIFLCGTLGSMRNYLTRERLNLINRVAGLVITTFGVALIATLIVATPVS